MTEQSAEHRRPRDQIVASLEDPARTTLEYDGMFGRTWLQATIDDLWGFGLLAHALSAPATTAGGTAVTDGRHATAEQVAAWAGTPRREQVVLQECNLTGANLRRLDLSGWTFDNCTLDDAELTRTDLSSTVWRGGSARRAKLIDADLVDAAVQGVDLSGAQITGALLTDAVFDGCRAMGASFERSRGLGVTFRSCDLYAANLDGCSFGGKPITDNRMDEVTLRKADLRGCVLDGTTLRNADLTGAKLADADLRRATLGDCEADGLMNIRGAIISPMQAAAILATVADILVS